jgi:limonene-1,2-epoxide hydrolase
VKSGKVEDVNDKTVEAFFREATPDHDNTRKMFSLMNMECLKWHTDRIPKLFGSDATDAALSELFKTIVRIVVKLRSEAQENRAR